MVIEPATWGYWKGALTNKATQPGLVFLFPMWITKCPPIKKMFTEKLHPIWGWGGSHDWRTRGPQSCHAGGGSSVLVPSKQLQPRNSSSLPGNCFFPGPVQRDRIISPRFLGTTTCVASAHFNHHKNPACLCPHRPPAEMAKLRPGRPRHPRTSGAGKRAGKTAPEPHWHQGLCPGTATTECHSLGGLALAYKVQKETDTFSTFQKFYYKGI